MSERWIEINEGWFQTSLIILSIISCTIFMSTGINIESKKNQDKTDRLYEMFIDLIKEGRKQ